MQERGDSGPALAVLLYGRLLPDAGPDDEDILHEAEFISGALTRLGYKPMLFEVGLDTSSLEQELLRLRPACIFNLADAIDGREEYVTVAPDMLERIGLRYTGTAAGPMRLASNKVTAKEIMRAAGIPTPAAMDGPVDALRFTDASGGSRKYIIKPVSGSASDGIDDDSVLTSSMDIAKLGASRLRDLAQKRTYIEPFIEGREFALALLGGPDGPQALPPSEILFHGYTGGKPMIVNYAAKWFADSFEYNHTPRRFSFPEQDRPLLSRLGDLALGCWKAFDLGGYARIDVRVDGGNEPWVIDINPNPCLAEDAGFIASAAQAGLGITDIVRRIISCPAGQPRRPAEHFPQRRGEHRDHGKTGEQR